MAFGSPVYTWSVTTGKDIAFKVWARGGLTTVTKNSKDPAQMLRDIVDFGKSRGSLITYDDTSIIDTDSVVSATFNTNKLTEAESAILKYAPSDWYMFYDPAELTANLRPRPEVVRHWFELGKNIENLFIEEDIESLVNEVYFTGGQTAGVSLFKHYVDGASQAEWRKGLVKLVDQRVTDATSAGILANSAITRGKDPIYVGSMSVLRRDYDDIVQPGDLIGYVGFSNFIDFLRLQAMYVKTSSDRIEITLGVMLPPVSKRVEDLKRNLSRLEQQNNPNAPT